jgi:hypothetical protein
LVQEFRASNSALTPRLADEIHSAWKDYILLEVNKGLPENEKIIAGNEDDAWKTLSQKIQDPLWKQECLKRYEKFDMAFSAAVPQNFRLAGLRNAHLTHIPPFSGKRSRQSRKLAKYSSVETPRTQTRPIGLSMSPEELLQDTWTDRRVERC